MSGHGERSDPSSPSSKTDRGQSVEETQPYLGDGCSAAKVIVEVVEGPHASARFEYDRPATLLAGRSRFAQLRLNRDPYFSRNHFRLEVNPPQCYLLDLGSRNGTFVNDRRVHGQYLKDGDFVTGGDTRLLVRSVIQSEFPSNGGSRPNGAHDAPRSPDNGGPSCARGNASPLAALRVPGYELIEQIGSGNMGIVYRAVQTATGEAAAVKLIVPEQSATQEGMRLFIREAGILSDLNHEGIVRFHGFGLTNGQPFLAMEYVNTEDMSSLLSNADPQTRMRLSCGIVCQLLDALSYAHDNSLVHRDIKPQNVLVARVDRRLRAKLSDFGLAKNYVNAGFSGITTDGQVRGTLAYMPPEQIIDCQYVKPTCDVYATGVTLYQFLAGRLPFRFTNTGAALAMILEKNPDPLETHCPHLPRALVEAVHCALAKLPEERFSSAREMRQALLPFARQRRT